ncbi:MAG: NAD(P)H-hydrate dehydratase [Candidatus Omnitrophica bacterium]|nr:NAD(P)H-hydrate dehydratase [Candidatus Omnitrophota bacterium]
MVREHIGKMSGRREDTHKGDYGKILVVGGSVGMTGAACLCSEGALNSGSGLVTCAVPLSLNPVMEVKLTEVMTLPAPETKEQTFSLKAKSKLVKFSSGCDAVALGPGLGRNAEIRKLVKALFKEVKVPVVLDADGINALAGKKAFLRKRAYGTVVTPHPGEMARLTGVSIEDIQADREGTAKSVAEETGTVVCLKGHKTCVACPDGRVYVNDTGNSGMASGGTGDVLTGMIVSFIGQGLELYSAAVSAVYLHGLAGDLAAEEVGPFSLTASDIIDFLPDAFDKAGI